MLKFSSFLQGARGPRRRTPTRSGPSSNGTAQAAPADTGALALTAAELADLLQVLDHAREQITELSKADADTVAAASGSALIPVLCARAGIAALRGHGSIPLLAPEAGLLEAAVLNLQSYQGNEAVLCTGHALLDALDRREHVTGRLVVVHGILAFDGDTETETDGPASALTPDGGGLNAPL
ncbi:hypothetical protein [Streptomyces sp. NPDC014805]|uniref:hypothetical protein n=1 Tax=Streptomyces sp. NPDC014805 TaxID=3364919 RepID=UPI00370170C6